MQNEVNATQAAILARNNVTVRGAGKRTIVFAHGFGCDQTMWRFVSPAFADEYRVVLFDYVGSGKADYASFDVGRYSQLDGYAQDLLEVCAALDLQQVIFVGHSVSSMIGLVAANQQPSRFARLVMLVPSPRYMNDAPDYVGGFERSDIEGLLEIMDHNTVGWADQFAPMVMSNPHLPELVGELKESFCSLDPVAGATFARTTFYGDNRADLHQVRVPTLIVQVSDDALVPLQVGHYLHAHLPASQLIVLEASGHCPHMSHPAETIKAIRDFIGRDARLG